MPFNHEDKVGYQELSPSLRELLDKIEAEVKGRQSEYIKGNADLIKNLQGRATKLENNDKLNSLYELTENDDEFSASGQVLKINPSAKKLYQHDEFLARRIVSNQYEKDDEMIRIPDTMEKIFTTWKRYAHFDRFSTMLLDRTNYGSPREYPEGQNLNHRIYTVYTDPNQTGWRFNKKTNCIEGTIDGVATAGFISPTADYANYYLKTMVDTGWDDDNLMIIIGYMKDSNGKEHTLSLVRGAGTFPKTSDQLSDIKNGKLEEMSSFIHNGKKLYKRDLYNIPARVLPKNNGDNFIIGNPTFTYPRKKFKDIFNSIDCWNHNITRQEANSNNWDDFFVNTVFPKSSSYYGAVFDCTFWWGLIYDMGNDTQFIITDLSDEVGPAPFATNYRAVETATTIAYISAQRDGNYFKFTTTGWSVDGSADTILPQGTFEFSCPEEKPATWSDEMYDNIQKMCLEPSHIGFGCRSGLPRFTIVEQQGIFKDENIYSVYEDKEYKFNPRTVGWDAIGKVSENKSFTQKIFLYNPRLKTLYWYNDAFDYTKISMHPELKEFTTKGRDGQILKYNGRKNTFQYDDEFHICNVVDNDKDFETIKSIKFSLKDVFDNWDRISGAWGDKAIPTSYRWQNYNNEGHIAARNAYSFDEASQMIVNSRNSYETSAFLAKDYYDKFKIKLGLNGYDDDDDPIFMIVGFMTDEKGIQHDISVVRCGGGGPVKQHETGPLFLMYDAMSYLCTREGQMTPNNIADHNSANYKMLILKGLEYSDDLRRMQWQDGEVELEIRRGKTSNGTPFIEARSCNPGGHIDYNNPNTFFRYELPRAVPEHWSAEQYLNVVNMLTSESKVGFGTQSNPCKFRIISQEGFIQDEKIYHLKRNRVYTRAQGSDWRENGTIPDHMMSKVLMYNKKTKKLFWYDTESQDKSTTDYLQLESKTKINPQNNDHDINASFIVGTFYDQTMGATIKVPTTSRKEISATIKITK